MRVIHKQAEQGHAVPEQVLEARGPFGKYEPKIVPVVPEEFPPGATAQNGMRGITYYRCNRCAAVLKEAEQDGHTCEGVY